MSVSEDGIGQDFQCLADQAVGSPCGLGFGSCTDGACIAQDEGDNVGACVSNQLEEDAFCGDLFGYCGDYLVCNKALETATFGTCKAMALAGQACGYGESWCVGGASCLYMDETQTAAQCYKDGFPGDTCGVGFGACLDGLNCVAENAGDASGVCTIP